MIKVQRGTAVTTARVASTPARTHRASCAGGARLGHSEAGLPVAFGGESLAQLFVAQRTQEQPAGERARSRSRKGVDAEASRGDSETLPRRRAAVRQKAFDALCRHVKNRPTTRLFTLATEVERALHVEFAGNEKEYFSKARSVLFNLGDPQNIDFRSKLLVGFIAPSEVPHLTASDMASHEKEVDRAKMRKLAMQEIDADWDSKRSASDVPGLLQCERCNGSRTTYFQLQTRSGDEPMTTYAACLECDHRW
eukprot:CAMPEP_0117533188 /NCGR_PEP_ID=MMETSP0784-20121206/39759_1 /TAXON_ID=39447 /ORGANISM="" /LENGTH=251 /DNA_ID=CAMNT_0005329613 /DNA_START=84 /DNA_END=836 /DNA_ORIENTATION=+